MAVELHHLRHPWRVRSVTILLGFEKPLLRPSRRLADVMRSRGIVVPLPLNLILVGVAGGDDVLGPNQAAGWSRRRGERHPVVARRVDAFRLATEIRRDFR